jgi:hypothetical protein
MAPIGTEDTTTAELETPTQVLPAVRAATSSERTAWHQRPGLALVAGLVGVVGLIALAVSVVTVSDESTRSSTPAPTTQTAPAQPTNQRMPPPPLATSSSPTSLSPTTVPPPQQSVSAAAGAPEDGPTAETITAAPVPDEQPAPGRYRRWLHRNFPGLFGGAGQ